MRTMRTTLDIDQDVLLAVKRISKAQGLTAGKVLSQLAREVLASQSLITFRNSAPLFQNSRQKYKPVTMELINEIRNEICDGLTDN